MLCAIQRCFSLDHTDSLQRKRLEAIKGKYKQDVLHIPLKNHLRSSESELIHVSMIMERADDNNHHHHHRRCLFISNQLWH